MPNNDERVIKIEQILNNAFGGDYNAFYFDEESDVWMQIDEYKEYLKNAPISELDEILALDPSSIIMSIQNRIQVDDIVRDLKK